MFTITPHTRIQEGVSLEDDRCTTGYEIITSTTFAEIMEK